MQGTSALDRAADWLYYNSIYKVLICRSCQHAIQKSAIDGHLLKHKIYRGERQDLLREIGKLHLLDPKDVHPPSHCPAPVEGLAILDGYCCVFGQCEHLTISKKRAKRHWSESHCPDSSLPPILDIVRPVYLQTLFKGTKVDYFVVRPPLDNQSSAVTLYADRPEAFCDPRTVCNNFCLDVPVSASNTRKPPSGSDKYRLNHTLDLEMLGYLHHFLPVTARTLPGGPQYWQEEVFALAREHIVLISGMLALAARQQALTMTAPAYSQIHNAYHETLYQDFQQMVHTTPMAGVEQQPAINADTITLTRHIVALLRCARSVDINQTDNHASWQYSSLREMVYDIGMCYPRKLALFDTDPIVDRVPPHDGLSSGMDQMSRALDHSYGHLHELPSRMAQVLGRPGSVDEAFITLAAISALHDCCERSFSCQTTTSAWEGMCAWLTLIPASFHSMFKARDVAAVAVFANWAGILVKRAEVVGCWPVWGMSEKILADCVGLLSTNAPSAMCLVADVLNQPV